MPGIICRALPAALGHTCVDERVYQAPVGIADQADGDLQTEVAFIHGRFSIALCHIRGAVQNRSHERGFVQQFDRTHQVIASRVPLRGDHQSAVHQRRE